MFPDNFSFPSGDSVTKESFSSSQGSNRPDENNSVETSIDKYEDSEVMLQQQQQQQQQQQRAAPDITVQLSPKRRDEEHAQTAFDDLLGDLAEIR